jgi:hypothetical protein
VHGGAVLSAVLELFGTFSFKRKSTEENYSTRKGLKLLKVCCLLSEFICTLVVGQMTIEDIVKLTEK